MQNDLTSTQKVLGKPRDISSVFCAHIRLFYQQYAMVEIPSNHIDCSGKCEKENPSKPLYNQIQFYLGICLAESLITAISYGDGYSDNHITRYLRRSRRWRVGWRADCYGSRGQVRASKIKYVYALQNLISRNCHTASHNIAGYSQRLEKRGIITWSS